MLPGDIALIRSSLTLVARDPDAFIRVFCQRLFLHAPEIRALLPAIFVREPVRLVALIQRAVTLLDRRDLLVEGLQSLGRLHAGYAALPSFYPVVARAFNEALARQLGPAWIPLTAQAWAHFEALVSRIMGAAHLAEYQRLAAV